MDQHVGQVQYGFGWLNMNMGDGACLPQHGLYMINVTNGVIMALKVVLSVVVR